MPTLGVRPGDFQRILTFVPALLPQDARAHEGCHPQ